MNIFPEYQQFSESYSSGNNQLIWKILPADLETPASVMLKLGDEKYCGLFESVEGGANKARYSFIALAPDLIFKCKDGKTAISRDAGDNFEQLNGNVFDEFRKALNESKIDIPAGLPPMSSGLFGYFSYDMVRYMEKLPDSNPDTIGIDDAFFFRPKIVIVFDSVKNEMIFITPVFYKNSDAKKEYDAATARIFAIINQLGNINLEKNYLKNIANKPQKTLQYTSNTTREEYHKMVIKAKEYILAGDVFQVVPSQRFTVEFDHPAFSLYRALRRLNPSPYSFYLKIDDFALVGSSPEILVRLRDGIATVRPIAGTRKRGQNKAEDDALTADLLSDAKELAEHLMLIDLGRNDIGRIAKTGTVKVTEKEIVEYYSHVMHIVSNIEGGICDDFDAIDALIAGFPVGTVSGAPKIRAMEIIDELEKERRSFYAGGVGYFACDGNVDTCISLRTGLVKNGKLYIQAGGGVVADSDPEAEYQESCNKAKALMQAAEEVINTPQK